MRLNRVLLLAAAINIMIFAMVFTISCSGDDGKSGKSGTGCTVEKNSDGTFKVVCAGEDVGSFGDGTEGIDGEPGAKGAQGDKGQTGKAGEGCWLGSKIGSTYSIICGEGEGEVKGYLDGCEIQTLGDYEISIKCGSTSLSLCGSKVLKPEESCSTDGEISLTPVPLEKCAEGTKAEAEFDPRTQYCGYASKAAFELGEKGQTVMDLCGTGLTENKPNETSWNDEYCKYTKPKEAAVSTFLCANKAKINEGSWKNEYCGYANASATTKSVIKGVCGDYIKGPNEEAFGKGYCMGINRDTTTLTKYTEAFCGPGKAASNKPNDGGWKNEYCGYATSSASSAEIKSLQKNACGDAISSTVLPKGPNYVAFGKGYCKGISRDTITLTVYTETFCGTAGKINDGKWNNQYCGYVNSSASVKTPITGACGDAISTEVEPKGPNHQSFNGGYCMGYDRDKPALTKYKAGFCGLSTGATNKPNDGKWNNQYCGYATSAAESSGSSTAITGACGDDAGGLPTGPNYLSFGGGYCMGVKGQTKTKYSNIFCADPNVGKPNEGSWKSEYCGYANATASIKTVQKGICDDDKGPHEVSYNDCYCEWKTENAGVTECTKHWCYNSSSSFAASAASAANKLNEGSWKAEYCFADGKKAVCGGGRLPNYSANSGDGASLRCVNPVVATSSSSSNPGGGSSSSIIASSSSSEEPSSSSSEEESSSSSAVCDGDNLGLCTDGSTCGTAGGYWDDFDDTCKETLGECEYTTTSGTVCNDKENGCYEDDKWWGSEENECYASQTDCEGENTTCSDSP
jgi:hypothetical protein